MFAIKAGIERFSAIKYIGREIVDPIIGPYIPEVIKHSDVWNILDNDNVKFAAHFIFSFVGGALIKSEWRSSFFYSSIGTGLLLTKSLSADFLTAGAIKIAINTVIDFTYMYAINPALGNFNHILFYQGVVNTIQILDYNLKHNIDYELSKEGLSIARFVVDGGIILGSSYGINFTPVHLHEMVYSIMRVYNTIEMVALIDSLLCSMKPKLKPLEVDMEVNKVAETCVDYGYLNVYEGICSGEDAILEVEAILH
jgi:hypothetical protein